jgi:hypothetical protein
METELKKPDQKGISRRTILIGGGASATLIAGGAASYTVVRPDPMAYGLRVLRQQFGDKIADDPEARLFLEAYFAASPIRGAGLWMRRSKLLTPSEEDYRLLNLARAGLVGSFMSSTTIYAHLRGLAPFEFVALFDPYRTPCNNQLTSNFDPVA